MSTHAEQPSSPGAFARFAVRDAGVLAATVGLAMLDARVRPGGGIDAIALGLVTGFFCVVSGFLAHEWGHLVGCFLSGAEVHAPKRLVTVFLFHYGVARSTPKQFLWMSYGGYLASMVGMAVILAWADLTTVSGITAVVLAGLGIAVTFALEIPTTIRVARGGPLPGHGGVYVGS